MELTRSLLGLGPSDFTTVGLLILLAAGVALFILIATHLVDLVVGPKRFGRVKHSTYESGMEPVGDTRRRFSVRFYLIAVLFLIFDVEIVFLYPWAVLFPRLRAGQEGASSVWLAWSEQMTAAGYTPGFLLAAIGLFFALLLVGFVYEWRRGVFKWN